MKPFSANSLYETLIKLIEPEGILPYNSLFGSDIKTFVKFTYNALTAYLFIFNFHI